MPDRFNRLEIAPFILLAFTENAFKHSANNQKGEKQISISLEIDSKQLHYEVINTVDNGGPDDESGISEGIGLKNLRKRLELQYTDHYDLKLKKNKDHFNARLVLDLNPDNKKI